MFKIRTNMHWPICLTLVIGIVYWTVKAMPIPREHHANMPRTSQLHKYCHLPPVEIVFNSIVQGLFDENMIPKGAVLDIGANTGDWTCFFACLNRERIFYAADPNYRLHDSIPCKNLTNVHVHTLAMSNAVGKIDFHPGDEGTNVGSLEDKHTQAGNVDVTTLDLFFQNRPKPAFMHLDVEGYELKLIQGGTNTIVSSRPPFSFEVHMNMSESQNTISAVISMGYSVFMVNEICGWNKSCRNLLALPQNTSVPFGSSQTLRLAERAGLLLQVTTETAKQTYEAHEHAAKPFER